VRLQRLILCCKTVPAIKEDKLLKILKLATSSTLGLQHLCLIGLHLPLRPPPPAGASSSYEEYQLEEYRNNRGPAPKSAVRSKQMGRTGWARFFLDNNTMSVSGLQSFEIKQSNFGDDQIGPFLIFMEQMKRCVADAKKVCAERGEAKEEATWKHQAQEEEKKKEKTLQDEKEAVKGEEEFEEGEIDSDAEDKQNTATKDSEANGLDEQEEGEIDSDAEDKQTTETKDSEANGLDEQEEGRFTLQSVWILNSSLTPAGTKRLTDGMKEIHPPISLYLK